MSIAKCRFAMSSNGDTKAREIEELDKKIYITIILQDTYIEKLIFGMITFKKKSYLTCPLK